MSALLNKLLDACRLRDCTENDRAMSIKTQAPFRESDFEPLTEADIALADGFGGGMVLDVDALRREGML